MSMRHWQRADQISVDFGKCLLGDWNMEDQAVLVTMNFVRLTGGGCTHLCHDIAVRRMPDKSVAHQMLGGSDARMQQSV